MQNSENNIGTHVNRMKSVYYGIHMPFYSLYMAWMTIKLTGENILVILPLMPYMLAQY